MSSRGQPRPQRKPSPLPGDVRGRMESVVENTTLLHKQIQGQVLLVASLVPRPCDGSGNETSWSGPVGSITYLQLILHQFVAIVRVCSSMLQSMARCG